MPVLISDFNRLSEADAADFAATLVAIPTFTTTMVRSRPFASKAAMRERAAEAASAWSQAEVQLALSGHPRIGERASAAEPGAGHSAREQGAVATAGDELRERIAEGNRRYEARFDRIFLVRAAGRSPAEILEQLEARLENEDDAELAVVASELRDITLLRLEESVTE
ncbi:OHCU decarboxylase [Pseudoclavibacter sp. Z016]|nr:OHCU decarboxylase [Pseudoclavibacter sp. Z016]